MPKVVPKNVADEMSKPYIDDAVDKQLKAADVPPRTKLDISFKDTPRLDDDKDYKSNQEAYEKNHGKLYEMTHNNTIPWKNYVVYFVLLSLLTTVFTFSRYMSFGNFSEEAKIASFAYTINATKMKRSDVAAIKIIESNDWKSGVSNKFVLDGVDLEIFEFSIINNGEVTIDVTPSKTITHTTGNKGTYDLKFKDKPDSTAKEISKITVKPGSTGYIYLWIDASDVIHADASIRLNFLLEQVD